MADLFYALDQVENVPLYFSYIEFLLHTGVNFFLNFLNFIFKLYDIVLVLPNIEMNPPQVYLCSPS